MLVPDNLRSAVKSFDKWSPGITDGLNELATHYACCALPTRVRKPKDKALVEDAVHKGYKRILSSQTQQYYAYSPQYFIDKGSKYGETVKHVLRELFSVTDKPAELYYRSAQGILALTKETEPKLFDMACSIAVKYDKCNYKFISNLVKSKCQGYLALQNGEMQTGISCNNHWTNRNWKELTRFSTKSSCLSVWIQGVLPQ